MKKGNKPPNKEKKIPYEEWRRNFAANTIGPDARMARQVALDRYKRLRSVMVY
jgi:hypothetical protein